VKVVIAKAAKRSVCYTCAYRPTAAPIKNKNSSKSTSFVNSSPLLLIVLAASFSTTCRTIEKSPVEAHGQDDEESFLTSDGSGLQIVREEGAVYLTVPEGWRVSNSMAMDSPTPIFWLGQKTEDRDHAKAHIQVNMFTSSRPRSQEGRLHESYLGHLHSNFPYTYLEPSGAVTLHDGRSVTLNEYFRGDVPELVGFITDPNFTTQFSLKAHRREELKASRGSFEELIRSYRFR